MKLPSISGSIRPIWITPAVLFGLLILMTGCSAEKTNSDVETPTSKQGNLFAISVVPSPENRRDVVVKVVAQDKSAWQPVSQTERLLDWAAVLSLRWISGDEKKEDSPGTGIAGQYSLQGNTLSFRPAFPLVEGQRYIARFNPQLFFTESQQASILFSEYLVPSQSSVKPPSLTAIYPSGDLLPANHLKFYLIFNEPMRQGKIFESFKLEDITTSQQVSDPFRNIELWSHDRLRLTLWFHPGRQKKGVNLNVELGPILLEGHEYELSVKEGWHSQSGKLLKPGVIKRFRAGPTVMKQLDHSKWDLSPPQAGTIDPLFCEFHQPLDWALLHSEIDVEFGSDNLIAGHIETGPEQSSIRFVPHSPWQAGKYHVVIGSVLEDLAGNSLERPFAVDLTTEPPTPVAQNVHLKFEVTMPPSAKKAKSQ